MPFYFFISKLFQSQEINGAIKEVRPTLGTNELQDKPNTEQQEEPNQHTNTLAFQIVLFNFTFFDKAPCPIHQNERRTNKRQSPQSVNNWF